MCLCFRHHRDWNLQLEVISEEGKIERYPYHVDVESDENEACCCGCCQNGIHLVKINGEVFAKEIMDNICFPLCCTGGDYEWQEKGHFFRLELPSLYIHDGLYVDGKEVQTRRLNTGEWKCQFAIWLVLGIIILCAGFTFIIIHFTDCCWKGFLYLGVSCLATGLLALLPGVIGCCRAGALSRQYNRLKQVKSKERKVHTTKF